MIFAPADVAKMTTPRQIFTPPTAALAGSLLGRVSHIAQRVNKSTGSMLERIMGIGPVDRVESLRGPFAHRQSIEFSTALLGVIA